jgi:ketosteroid isomerase-like protein
MDEDSVSVMNAVTTFVTAFNNFDWPTFRSSFTDDATVFHPTWSQARRLEGRAEIESVWLAVFPEFTDPNNKEKLQIDPRNVHLQIYENTAIITFHLGDGVNSLSRRTLVMVKKESAWKIIHLHASRVNDGKS